MKDFSRIALLLGILSTAALAKPHVKAELVGHLTPPTAGQDFVVGIRLQHDPKWHTYWNNPGDSGIPTRVEWTLSPGYTAGEIEWPIPERIESGPLVSFGYSDDVLLLTRIHAPAALGTGAAVFKANVKWLECREICVPGKATLVLRVPTGGVPKPTVHAALFEKAFARLPSSKNDWKSSASGDATAIKLKVGGSGQNVPEGKITFFPWNKGEFAHGTPQPVERSSDSVAVKLTISDQHTEPFKRLQGLLVAEKGWGAGYEQALWIDTPVEGMATALFDFANTSLIQMLLFAFLGGLILNLMPCVFPVLSIKILSFVEQGKKGQSHSGKHGAIFTLGVLVSFWLLAGTLLALRAAGEHLGWGFQLQSPVFLVVLSGVMFLLGLNLLGTFEMGGTLMSVGSNLTTRAGYVGSFFTGVLATVVATPCTAPFMGTAVGFALAQGPTVCMLTFTFLGLGMALPYFILSCFPRLLKFLPKPGRWMESLKHLMAFPLFATVIWLVWVFGQQVGIDAVAKLLMALLLVSISAWILGRWATYHQKNHIRLFSRIAALALAALALAIGINAAQSRGGAAVSHSENVNWVPYTKAKLAELRRENRIVFLDFTAAWCLSCQVNEKLVFGSSEVLKKVAERKVVTLKADWTNGDPEITDLLAQYGRSGVPFYLLYSGGADHPPKILPEVLTPGIFLEALNQL